MPPSASVHGAAQASSLTPPSSERAEALLFGRRAWLASWPTAAAPALSARGRRQAARHAHRWAAHARRRYALERRAITVAAARVVCALLEGSCWGDKHVAPRCKGVCARGDARCGCGTRGRRRNPRCGRRRGVDGERHSLFVGGVNILLKSVLAIDVNFVVNDVTSCPSARGGIERGTPPFRLTSRNRSLCKRLKV
jgi:hypothetical protein